MKMLWLKLEAPERAEFRRLTVRLRVTSDGSVRLPKFQILLPRHLVLLREAEEGLKALPGGGQLLAEVRVTKWADFQHVSRRSKTLI